MQEWRQLKQELKRSDEPLQGRLRVFCSVTASYFLLPEVLERFRRRYPQLEIKLETGDPALAVDKILADEADLAIAARPDALSAKLEFASLQQVPLVFIAPRTAPQQSQWFSQGEPDWERLPLILSEQGLARKRCDQWLRNKGSPPTSMPKWRATRGLSPWWRSASSGAGAGGGDRPQPHGRKGAHRRAQAGAQTVRCRHRRAQEAAGRAADPRLLGYGTGPGLTALTRRAAPEHK